MTYFTKDMTIKVLEKMKLFENDLRTVFCKHNYTFNKNLGRRNALLSEAQEKEVAIALREAFNNVEADGAPGQPDVLIHDINRELECKITSGRGKSKVVEFQTDWATLQKKGALDYLYFVCNDNFDKFCVLFFEGLTTDDFYPPASGSRGKSRMNKKVAMAKATCLHGDVIRINDVMIKKYEDRIKSANIKKEDEITNSLAKLLENNDTITNAATLVTKVEKKYDKKIKDFYKKISNWSTTGSRYSYILSET